MKAHILILLVIIPLLSCVPTRNFSFEILLPATIDLPDNQGKYLVLNCSYLPEDTIKYFDQLNLKVLILDTLIIKHMFEGLFGILDESPFPGLNNADYLEIRTFDTTGFLNPLSTLAISDICNDYNKDHIISFEYYNFDYRIAGYSQYAFLRLKNKLVWRIYEKDGKILDSYEQSDTLFWNSTGVDYWDAKDKLGNLPDYLREAFFIAGSEYGQRISPYWKKVNRLFYEIREKTDSGRIKVTQDKNSLLVQSNSENKRKAFKACYNLAVLSESEGDINNALSFIDKALKYRNNYYVRKYNKTLKKRLNAIEILNNQLVKTNIN